jgi:hypothetical protein
MIHVLFIIQSAARTSAAVRTTRCKGTASQPSIPVLAKGSAKGEALFSDHTLDLCENDSLEAFFSLFPFPASTPKPQRIRTSVWFWTVGYYFLEFE